MTQEENPKRCDLEERIFQFAQWIDSFVKKLRREHDWPLKESQQRTSIFAAIGRPEQ